jgi:hypothetical protein
LKLNQQPENDATKRNAAAALQHSNSARRFYNGNGRDCRNKYGYFPRNLVAQMSGFPPHDFFTVPPAVSEVPNADFGVI